MEISRRWFDGFVAAQVILWTLAPALSHSAPPMDVVEMYVWGREGVIATYKHPDLPGLVLEAVRRMTGATGWPAYLISQLFVAATFAAVYALGRRIMDEARALGGTFLLAGVYYFSWPTPEFNHNVALMPFWALFALALWQAVATRRLYWWISLGLAVGAGMWAKYCTILLPPVALAWMLADAEARRTLRTAGPWIAVLVAAVIAAPQAIWIVESHFAPLRFVQDRARGSENVAVFLFDQLLDHAPMLVMLAAAGLLAKPLWPSSPGERRGLRFLLIVGFGPPVLSVAAAMIAGTGLKSAWATPMFNLSGLIVMAVCGHRLTAARLKRLAVAAGVMLVLVSSLYYLHLRLGPTLTHRLERGNYPMASMSRRLEDIWTAQTHAPLRIVAGTALTAGMVGFSDRAPPSVLIEGDFAKSPWITPRRLKSEGALLVWRDNEPPPLNLAAYGLKPGQVAIPVDRYPNVGPVVVSYAVLPPATKKPEP